MMATIELVTTRAEERAAYQIRRRVFVVEQGVPSEVELDELDGVADHFVARLDGRAVGAGRLVTGDGVGVLGRLAVLAEARGTGLGVTLVAAIERRARTRGLAAVELHAQTDVRGFYERLGYVAYGEVFEEAGIPHISMRKPLPPPL